MNKWDEIKSRLEHLGGQVTLLADGYRVTLRKMHNGKRIFVVVYVDGHIRGEWFAVEGGQPMSPEARFWRPVKRAAYKRKAYNQLKRAFGKKKADQMVAPQVVAFTPDFGTEGSAVAHLKKNFPDLEIQEAAEA